MKKEYKECFITLCIAIIILLGVIIFEVPEYISEIILGIMLLYLVPYWITIIIIRNIPIVIEKIFVLIRKRKILDKIDFTKYEGYYREILEYIPPLIIGYLDNFEINKNKMVAEILYLEKKNKIQINDEKLVFNGEYYGISNCEKYFCDNIKNGKLIINDELEKKIKEKIQVDAYERNLIKKNNKKTRNLQNYEISLIEYVILLIGMIILSFMYLLGFYKAVVIVPVFALIIIGIVNLIIESSYVSKYKRTSKGRELNQKLEGLKNYLKDYSLMDERDAKEIELWDDYLIYSVMFGQNKKIIEEYEKYIEIIE